MSGNFKKLKHSSLCFGPHTYTHTHTYTDAHTFGHVVHFPSRACWQEIA